MEFHPKAEEALRKKLKDAFEYCVLQDGWPQLSTDWAWEYAKEAEKYTKPYLSSSNAWGHLIGAIRDIFKDLEYDKKPSGKLVDILQAEGQQNLEDKIISFLKSLPYEMTYYLKLGRYDDELKEPIKISDSVRLLQVNSDTTLLQMDEMDEWKNLSHYLDRDKVFHPSEVVLELKLQGYASTNMEDNLTEHAISMMKTIFYVCLTLDLIQPHETRSAWSPSFKGVLFLVDGSSNSKLAKKLNVPPESASLFGAGRINLSSFNPNVVRPLSEFIKADEADENKKFIITSVQWGFDSLASKNETVSFIQLCIALEAILGDEKNKEGITRMLADRCAFMLGRNTKERNILREKFLLLYDQRSKLVHGRQIKLPQDSHKSLDWGRKVLDAIIRKEYGHFS